MTDSEKLRAVIQKAIDGGWKSNRAPEALADSIIYDGTYDQLESLIFNHDFAKALWGDVTGVASQINGGTIRYIPAWQYHIQQMVISEGPIDYAYHSVFSK